MLCTRIVNNGGVTGHDRACENSGAAAHNPNCNGGQTPTEHFRFLLSFSNFLTIIKRLAATPVYKSLFVRRARDYFFLDDLFF
jgi:hypothetical protein